MPNSQVKTFFLVITIKSAVKCQIFRRPLFLVRWNGVGQLEPCWAWHGRRDEIVADSCRYFWADVDGSPMYNEA